MVRSLRVLATTLILLAVWPVAHAQIYRVTLSGLSENPPVVTPGTGSGIVMLNGTTHIMRVNANFTGLTGTTTASHIHCCTPPAANASVATTSPTFVGFPLGVTSGGWDTTYDMTQTTTWNAPFLAANGGTPAGAEAALIAASNSGLSYLNVHSTTFSGGEIRGTLILQTFVPKSTEGTRPAAVALDALGTGSGAMSDALMSLALLTDSQQTAALEKLTPTPSNGAYRATSERMTSTFDQVSFRIAGLRLADAGHSASTFAGGNAADMVDGIWLRASGVSSRQKMDDDFAGYKNNAAGLTVGFDHRFAQGFFGGASLSYADAEVDYRDDLTGNSDDVTSSQVTLYATQDIGQFYVDGMLSYAWQKYDSRRDTGIRGIAAGDYDGHQTGGRISGGMPLAVSDTVSVTPQAHLDWDSINQDGYTESGAGALALNVEAKSADRIRSSLGAQLDIDTTIGGITTRPFLRAFWHHDFKNDGVDAAASFVGGGTSFVTPGQKLESNSYVLGTGVNFYTRSYMTASLTYDATLSSSYRSHLLQAKASWMF